MRSKGMAHAALILSAIASTSAIAAEEEHWTTWRNARFAFSICYPAAVFPNAEESP